MSANGSNGTKNSADYARLDGREFEIVKQGLDIDQIKEFIEELRAERDKLLDECNMLKQREEHYKSLTRLAEKTVMEADKLASEIKAEMMQKAVEEADQMREEVNVLLLKVYDGISDDLDSIKEKVNSSRFAFEKSLMPSDNGNGRTPVDARSAVMGRPQEATSPAVEDSLVTTLTAEEKGEPVKNCPDENLMARIHDKEIQLDIMPPIDIALVSKIITNLYDLPQVEDAELLTDSDCPSIVIMESEPIELSKFSQTLAEFPQIEEAKVTESESGCNGGRSRKIELVLAGNKK